MDDHPELMDEQATQFILEGTGRMISLVTDLLTFSRVRSRGLDLQPLDLSVDVAILKRTYPGLTHSIDGDVTGDPVQIGQVLQNLVGNAFKFGGQNVHVRVWTEDDHHQVSVQDDGIGIAPQYHEQVFSAFRRLHGRGEYDGNGIGLAIVQRVAERHHGDVTVQSDVGQGTTFTVRWPVQLG